MHTILASRQHINTILKAISMFSGSIYLIKLLGMFFDLTAESDKSKMAASKMGLSSSGAAILDFCTIFLMVAEDSWTS